MTRRVSWLATALLLGLPLAATAGFVPAAPAVAAGTPVPPRITAVLPDQNGCTTRSARPVAPASYTQQLLQLPAAWQLSAGDGVTVAVLDTGIDLRASPQLAGQVRVGRSTVPGRSTTADCVGHGTFVAGLVAARPRRGSSVVGVAPRSHVLAIAVTDPVGATGPDQIGRGISAAVDAGARVVLASATASSSSRTLSSAVRRAVARGALVVAPATADDQNTGDRNTDGRVYPAALPGVLSVANTSARTDPSGTGATAPADLDAPADALLSVGPGGGVFIGSGAAYAAALTAGTAALVMSYRPQLSAAQVQHRLEVTAYPPSGAAAGAQAGSGMLDPYAAVATVLPEESSGAAGASTAPPAAPAGRPATVPAAPDTSVRSRARLLAALSGGVAGLVLLTSATAWAGHRRGWRPGSTRPEPPALPWNRG